MRTLVALLALAFSNVGPTVCQVNCAVPHHHDEQIPSCHEVAMPLGGSEIASPDSCCESTGATSFVLPSATASHLFACPAFPASALEALITESTYGTVVRVNPVFESPPPFASPLRI